MGPIKPPARERQEESISAASPREIDGFVAGIYARLEPELSARGFIDFEFRVILSLHEAVINAWQHGNRKEAGKPITVRWRFTPDLILEVLDQGDGFAPPSAPLPIAPENLAEPCGRGIRIITSLADRVHWLERGSHLVACFGKTPRPLGKDREPSSPPREEAVRS